MRRIKKALAAFAVVCMLSPCISMIVHAASAELRFTDPSTTVRGRGRSNSKVNIIFQSSVSGCDTDL